MKTVFSIWEAMDMADSDVIPVGTVIVVPAGDTRNPIEVPWTLVMDGQRLSRSLYPELSQVYAGSGRGDYTHIKLEDLEGRFSLGFDENGEMIRGTALIYYQTVKGTHAPEPDRDFSRIGI
jgi:hypothetical protein